MPASSFLAMAGVWHRTCQLRKGAEHARERLQSAAGARLCRAGGSQTKETVDGAGGEAGSVHL